MRDQQKRKMTHHSDMSLRSRLLKYLQRKRSTSEEYLPKDDIVDIVRSKMNVSSDYVTRTLREMTESGIIEVDYRDQNYTKYRAKLIEPKGQVVEKGGHRVYQESLI